MGTCCSNQANSDENLVHEKIDSTAANRRSRSKSRPSTSPESRAPPPTMEVVKEVLSVSETPKPPISDRRFLSDEKIGSVKDKNKEFVLAEAPAEEEIEIEISEAVAMEEEICSLSESLSTTNVTNDDEDESANNNHYNHNYNINNNNNNARVWNRRSPMKPPPPNRHRSLSGELVGRRERVVAGVKSPSRRTESSPGRRFGNGPGSVRTVQPKNMDSGRVGARRGLIDPGEGSARRSRSPAMRSGGTGRSARSPGRVNGVSEHSRKCIDNEEDESLDNPLVSLECFIFL